MLQIFLGLLAFIVVVGGGVLLGIIFGVISAVITKFTNSVRVVEPIAVFGFAYLSYVMAELFEFSGIISIIVCGLVMMQYTFHNITDKSRTTIKYFTKVIATTNEIVIFLLLGLALVRTDHDFHVGFLLWTVFLTLLFRVFITYGLSFLLNRFDKYRVRQLSLEEQFIISYGGLRGAVCFSLVAMLEKESVPHKPMFVTTTLAVIIFTVFVQGITIKPFVSLLKIGLASHDEPTLYQELNSQVTDHMMAGVEDIIGFHGKYYLKELLEFYDDKYLKRWLQNNPRGADEDIVRIYSKLALRDHVENLYACNAATIPNSESIARALPLSPEDRDLLNQLVTGQAGCHGNQRTIMEPTIRFSRGDTDEDDKLITKPDDVEIEMGRPFTRRKQKAEIKTYKDLRKHLVRNPSRMMMHMKYDPNIKSESKTDFVELLREKHMRNRRLQEHAVSLRPGLERCMSWAGNRDDRSSVNEANARLRHYKAMSLDVNNLKGHPGLPGGALGAHHMPEISEREEAVISPDEDKKNLESSERKRSLFKRADAMTEDTSNENIPMSGVSENDKRHSQA